MSGPFGSSQWMYASGGFYPYEIDQSVRFNAADSAYLEKTFSTTGDEQIFTISFWFKRCRTGTAEYLFSGGNDVSNRFHMDINASGTFQIEGKSGGSTQVKMEGGPVLRDVGAWYHFVLRVDTTQATASDRVRLYVNGELLTFNSNTYPSQNANLNWNINDQVRIGRAGWDTNYFDGYFAEFINVDGSSLAPTSFGETKAGIWVPKDYTGSYGTNGFKLAFQDSAALGDDTSGNGNDFTSSGLASTDQMPDSPTNNRITFNGLSKDLRYSTALTDGNKTINFTSGSTGFSCCPSTIFRSQGQAYCEFELDTAYSGDSGDGQVICVFEADADIDTISGGGNSKLAAAYNSGGSTSVSAIYDDGVSQGAPTKFTTAGQRIGVYIDYDAGKGWFSHEGTVQTVNGTPDVSAGTNPHFTFTANTPLTVGAGGIHAGTPAKITMHDHPDDWETTPPSDYTAFAAVDLADPGIDPAADEAPTDYFNTVLYTGDGSTSNAITGVGFSPDFVWIKKRGPTAANNRLLDTVRGVQKNLYSDQTNTEETQNSIMSFDSDGFTLGDANGTNQSTHTFVSWNWKAGGTAVSNTEGSITSSVSASPESGFSIVTYTGTSNSNATVGHGLGVAPTMVFVKPRTEARHWLIWHTELNDNDKALLFDDDVPADNRFGPNAPTTSVFGVYGGQGNRTGTDFVAYCFADVDGMVKAGSYVGNGSSDGPFVYTGGFRPAFVMFKNTTTVGGHWVIYDAVRDTFNPVDSWLNPNRNNTEGTDSAFDVDFVSNGFKVRNTDIAWNTSGDTFVYLAFAEQPFKYANAR